AAFAAFALLATFAAGLAWGVDGALEHAASVSASASATSCLAQRIGPSTRCSARSVHRLRRSGGRSSGGSCRRAIGVTVDRAEEAGADLRLRVATRHQLGEARQALLDPAVVEVIAAHQLEILLVHLDRLLLERERLFVERVFVLLQLRAGEIRRTLRLAQRAAEFAIDLAEVIRRRGGDVGDLIVDQVTERIRRRLHATLLLFEALLERLRQLQRREARVDL